MKCMHEAQAPPVLLRAARSCGITIKGRKHSPASPAAGARSERRDRARIACTTVLPATLFSLKAHAAGVHRQAIIILANAPIGAGGSQREAGSPAFCSDGI